MPNPRAADLIDDDEDDVRGEDVLQDIASTGGGSRQGQGQDQKQRANGHADDVEIVFDNGDGDEGDEGDDQGQQRDTRLTEDDQPSASYLDQQQLEQERQGRSKNVRRREARDRNLMESAQLRARLAASDARFAAMQNEVAELRKFAGRVEPQLAQFSESQLQNKLSTVDSQLARAGSDLEAAEKAIANGLSENDTDAVLKAMRTRDQAFIASEKLRNEKTQLTTAIAAATKDRGTDGGGKGNGAEDRKDRQDTQALPAKASAYMREFLNRFPWANPKSADPRDRRDGKIVSVLDDEVMAEGYDPNDPVYWRELEARMRESVPQRFDRQSSRRDSYAEPRERSTQRQQPARNERRGPPTSAPGTGGGPRNGRMVVRLTPERREALELAGLIDGNGKPIPGREASFKNIVTQYAEDDRANGASR